MNIDHDSYKTEVILYTRGLLVNKSRKILEFNQLIKKQNS